MEVIKNISPENASFYVHSGNYVALAEISLIDKKSFSSYLSFCTNPKILEKVKSLDEPYYFFNRINVPKTMRGQKIGSLLLASVLEHCAKEDITLLNTASAYGDMKQKDLIAFYKNAGMTLIHNEGLLLYHSSLNPPTHKIKP